MASASPSDHAHRLLAAGDRRLAIATAEAGANAGDASCLMLLAIWRLIGDPLARDVPRARALLQDATRIGHADAALMEVALTANGSGASADWPAAYRLLQAAAATDQAASQQLRLIDAMATDAAGMPTERPRSVLLCEAPLIERFPNFISAAEAGQIAASVQDMMAPAVVVDPRTGHHVAHPTRTSDGATVGPTRENLVIRTINQRIAAVSGTDVSAGEPLSVLRYAPGQQYRLHSDALPPNARSQRVQTVLIYLNDGYGGGETDFPKAGIRIAPRAGDAIRFSNILLNGTSDPASVHAGLPVTHGVKWLATRWIRSAPYDPWNPA